MARSSAFFTLLIAVINAGVAFAGIGPAATLTISNGNVSPDGFTRAATLTNGKIDGPLITAQKGDNFQLNVVNNLDDNTMYQTTTIHWHGFFQHSTAWADGPAFVTQCPITKNTSFLYNFQVPDQAGTFWYHGHLATQYCDGLRGPMVVYDPQDPYLSEYDVDDDSTVITLSDWYHTVSKQAGAVPTADSTLINGLGRWTGDTTAPLSVISVTQGQRYRFRLANIGCDPNYVFSIDGHTFTVIEADGVLHQPQVVDSIQIYTGQRYSFILNANQTIDNYWVRAKPNRAAQTTFANGLNTAILRYVGAPATDPTAAVATAPTSTLPLQESALVPLGTNLAAPGQPTPGGADKVWNLAITFTNGQFAINGVPFVNPSVPVLLQILSGAQTPSSLLPTGSIYSISPGDVIELTIPGGTIGAPHPFHLHGHTFYVVRSAGQTTPNYVNPPRRDVVNTGTSTSDNVTIRFVADNPGPWFLHCHIDWHLNAGLALVFAEDAADWQQDIVPPAAWNQLCTNYDNADPSDL